MYVLQASWFVLAFTCSDLVKCVKACEFSNLDYKTIVLGIEGKVKSSESLYRDIINSEVRHFNYSLNNITLTGMKDCEAIHVQCDKNQKNESTFQYHLQCPNLLTTLNFETNGTNGDYKIEAYGSASISSVNYVIMFNGIYENVIGEDQKSHLFIQKYTLDTDPKGMFKFQIQLDDKNREELANRYFNENWREMEKLVCVPTITNVMELFIENFNTYLKVI